MKKLEDELGVALFERGGSEVSVTPVGTRIVEQAQRVLEEASAIKQIAVDGKDEESAHPRRRPVPRKPAATFTRVT